MEEQGKTIRVSTLVVAVVAFILGAAVAWFALQFMSGGNIPAQEQATSQEQSASQVQVASQEQPSSQDQTASQEPSVSQNTQSSVSSTDAVQSEQNSTGNAASAAASISVVESGTYTSKDEVAAYIHEFGHLPSNYISKSKAKKAGWVSKEGNLDEVLPGMSIGGSEFYNDEGQLPDAPGRTWTECDINYTGGYRGAERIVFSSDGLIFYTADHYETFEQLY